MTIAKRNFMMKLTFLSAFLLLTNICQAVEENWQTKIIPQLYFQNYSLTICFTITCLLLTIFIK